MTTKTKSPITDTANIIFEEFAVTAARLEIVKCSKKMESDIASIDKCFQSFKDNWESPTATYYQDTVSKKVKEIQKEQQTLATNLEKYLSSVVKAYEQSEKNITKNADLFK